MRILSFGVILAVGFLLLVSLSITSALAALMVWIGALVTALLFHLGRWLIGLYLANATQPSAFGAAASFAAMLLWLYYSAQIFLLGAEFTACAGGLKDESKRSDRAAG